MLLRNMSNMDQSTHTNKHLSGSHCITMLLCSSSSQVTIYEIAHVQPQL
jgi:hypothetical protein